MQQGTVDMGAYESPDTTPVTQIAFLQQPTDAQVNATISPAVTVQLLDVRGNLVTTASDSVTLSISTNPGGGSLGGTVSVNAVNGVATFSDLSIDAAGDWLHPRRLGHRADQRHQRSLHHHGGEHPRPDRPHQFAAGADRRC